MTGVIAVINGLGTGGAERSLAESIEPLHERGVDVEVAVLHLRSEGVEAEVRALTPVHHIGSSPRAQIASLRALIKRGRFGVIHTTLFEADLVGRLASIASGVPVLTSLVNTSYDPVRLAGDPNLRRSRFEAARLVDAATGRLLSDHYHAITQVVAESARDRLHVPASKITVIPRGRSRERLGEPSPERRTRVRRGLGLDATQPVILAVGRQEYQKGHLHLLQAFDLLASRHPRAVLLLAGREGNSTSDIRRHLDGSPYANRVRTLGHRSDVPDLMVAADVLAFPSKYEGLGGTLIEAMALGTPIVATDIPVIREVVGSVGRLVGPADAPAFARQLEDLCINPQQAAALASGGMERFATRYEQGQVMDEMASLFREIAHADDPA